MKTWFLPQLVGRVQTLLGPDYPVTTEVPEGQAAWLAVPIFGAAKKLGQPVPELAAHIAQKLETIVDVRVTVAGGFVNITPINLTPVLAEAQNPSYPNFEVGAGKTVLVEFSSPNIAKPMSIGHLRSTIIGDALQRIYRMLGYQTVGINHVGDWGTQFGKLLVAYQAKFGDLRPRPELTIPELLELYVGFHDAAEKDPDLDESARAMFKRLEDGDPTIRILWESLVAISLAEFGKIYDRLGTNFDEPRMGESFYESSLPKVIQKAVAAGRASESDGALVIRLPGMKAPLILRKKDGATLYATRDLAAIDYRVSRWQPAKIFYVVGNEQTLHFEQVFAAAKELGLAPKTTDLVHVKFGLIRLPEGKMSTRKGRVLLLEDVLDEAVRRARAVVDEKNSDLSDSERGRIAEVVGIGAVKYFDLSHDRKHDIVFDWDRMLQLTGDSGPYLQYSYVRAAHILAKAGNITGDISVGQLPADIQRLIRELARFPLVIERAATFATPHTLAQYLNELATHFSQFYEAYPVLTAEKSERAVRLAIVAGVANVLKRGLNLLGIETLDRL